MGISRLKTVEKLSPEFLTDMAIRDLTRETVLLAVQEFDSLGRTAFLEKYGFKQARIYYLALNGRIYDSKAIAGAAHGYLGPKWGPLKFNQFSGGLAYVGKQLTTLGFDFGAVGTEDEILAEGRKSAGKRRNNPPKGNPNPARVERTVALFVRDPEVVSYALERAAGMCELCGEDAPFSDTKGNPFLEVHHIIFLRDGGGDLIENVAALCPNCHQACHHSKNRKALRKHLINTRSRSKS